MVVRGDYGTGMLLATGDPRPLGAADDPVLRFGEEPKEPGTWAGRRLLWLADRPAFELSLWCGTCPLLFRRLEGAADTASLPEQAARLAAGIDRVDDEVVGAFGRLLAHDTYLPMLLEIRPRLVRPFGDSDYFAEEQVRTWGVDAFWGLPEYTSTPYYRTFSTRVDDDAHLYEFVVPMVPPTWNDPARVAEHADALAGSTRPTAVAVSTLDVCAPAVADGPDWCSHWGLSHFLLDGHHKLAAAAAQGRTMRLLALLAFGASLSGPDDVARVPELRSRAARDRDAPAPPG